MNLVTKLPRQPLFWIVLGVKVFCSFLFGSIYLRGHFTPFVNYFIASGFNNPWDYFYSLGLKIFPYPPAMLAILTIPKWIVSGLLPTRSYVEVTRLDLFLMRVPLLLADTGICLVLFNWFKDHRKVIYLYWCSPLLFYISYYHGQLDIIPTFLLVLSLHLLFTKRLRLSATLLGLALATKGHILIAIPFYFIFAHKQHTEMKKLCQMGLCVAATYLAFVVPYLPSPGYQHLVMHASEQLNLFAVRIPFVGASGQNLVLFVAPAFLLIIMIRFFAYQKLNKDITILYFALVFSSLVVLVPPMPGWYFWSYPFLVYFFLRAEAPLPLLWAYNLLYLAYFLISPFSDLFDSWPLANAAVAALPHPFDLLKLSESARQIIPSLIFTALQSTTIILVYWVYKLGVLSNEIYRSKNSPLLIGIGGDSGAGKDTTLNVFKAVIGEKNSIALSGDDYHRWPRGHQEWQVYTHLDAKGNKLHDQLDHAIALLGGKSVAKVEYDHASGQFTRPKDISPNKIVFFVGLHPFYLENMRKLMDLKIFIEPDEALRLYWKTQRDMHERGYSPEQVQKQLDARNDDSAKFIKPQKQFADLHIRFQFKSPETPAPDHALAESELKLTCTLNNSFNLYPLVQALQQEGSLQTHHNTADIQSQDLIVDGSITVEKISDIANRIIPNLDELVSENPQWKEGYMGVLQLIFLVCVSHILKLK